ncbi:amidohydrolase family protein [Rubellimicrobium arenae]|uniref:amidohydrolase family protein n=1 Tax=Rubellimicrobium arenae TaxID=2817372 RepID=UPI001B301CD9|nr:amidohydrolase family protein [Rubellimicrobium arenae]
MLDAHQHFWTVARGDYGWMTPDLGPLLKDFGPEDLAPLMGRAGITRTILVQAAETEAETDFLLDLAQRTDFVAGVVGWLDMTSTDFPARLAAYRARPKWVGLRPMLQEHEPDHIRNPVLRANLRHVEAAGVPFDILTHTRHLPVATEVLAEVPRLRAVLDHLSKPRIAHGELDPWRAQIDALASMPNVSCKVSGMVTEAGADWTLYDFRSFVGHVARAFGPGRLMFGTDWPVCTLAASHAEVVLLARTLLSEMFGPEDLKQIFETNAAAFYGV